MATTPKFAYFVSTGRGDEEAGSDWLERPLPVSRHGEEDGEGPSYGDFFGLLRLILAGPALPALAGALGGAAPGQVAITAEKHGALYHPVRVEIEGGGNRAVLCANCALAPMARFMARREAEVLEKLDGARIKKYLPACLGVFEGEAEGLSGSVLLTSWLSGFFEFHLASGPASGGLALKIWDTVKGPCFADEAFLGEVYGEACRILSYYYEPVAGEQISPWHHAAGDFVVRPGSGGKPEVALITARGHDPLLGGDGDDLPDPMDSGLYFFVNTMLRMRLDREDGTGGLVFAPETAVEKMAAGFFEGLSDREDEAGAGGIFSARLLDHLIAAGPDGLAEAAFELLSACDPKSPDVAFLAPLAAGHSRAVFSALSALKAGQPS